MIHYITTQGIGNAWVGNELRVVARNGIPFVVHAMRPSERALFRSAWAREIDRSTRVIYPTSPLRIAAAVLLAPVLFKSRFFSALLNALFGRRESLRCRLVVLFHFLVACHWARGLRSETVRLIHSQWIHSCGTIGMYGAWLLKVPFSFTGHATDLFRDRAALEDKVRRAHFIVCISTFHRDLYEKLGAARAKLRLAYCGIDVDRFRPVGHPSKPVSNKLRIRSSGRLVEKKGFRHLIEASRLLKGRGVEFECVIAGSGPLEESLRRQVHELGIQREVQITGNEILQEDLPGFLHGGDVYCLPCVWAADDDVDGLPQMLMEAMACGLPAVSTRLVGIPDLIEDGETGILVEPGSATAICDAIVRLHGDPELRRRLARAGRERVAERFNLSTCLEPLLDEFRKVLRFPSPPEDRSSDRARTRRTPAPARAQAARRSHRSP